MKVDTAPRGGQDWEDHLRAVARERSGGADPAHDYLHVLRVTANARRIATAEGADEDVVVPAALLHEIFNYPKDHPLSHLSGDKCAEEAAAVLAGEGWAAERVEAVAYCIRVHSFSRGIVPVTLEGQVVQDADRLDAIGAVGVARCFSTGASLGRPFYQLEDPFCRRRPPDDKEWTVDHFYRKLLHIPETLHTATAHRLAEERMIWMKGFLAQFEREMD